MPTFRYKAYSAAGASLAGTIEADSERQAVSQLKEKGLLPREVREEVAADQASSSFSFQRSVSTADLALFTRRLATLTASSVPLFEAMGSLHKQEESGKLKQVLTRVRDRISEGASLSRAFAADPKVFGESYVSMVAAGEAGGALDVVLERLADFLEEQEEVRGRVTSALIYPILMVLVGGGVMTFLLTVVIPKIVVIFEDSKAALPLITVLLIKLSHLLRDWWWIPSGMAMASVPFYRKAMLRDAPRLKRDALLLRLPLAGSMLQRLILSRFARVLGLLLASGVPIIRALEITSEVLVNRVLPRLFAWSNGRGRPRRKPYPPALEGARFFHRCWCIWWESEKKGGTLEAMLLKAGAAFETRVQYPPDPFDGIAGTVTGARHGSSRGNCCHGCAAPYFRNEPVD